VYIEGINSDRDIEKMIGEIEGNVAQKNLKSQLITRYIPLFHIPIGFALFLLLIAMSSMSKREVVNIPSAFIVALLLSASVPSNAGILDFKLLSDAKKAYENKEYKTSSSLYETYVKKHDVSEANSNYASSLYKEKNYSKAIDYYKKVHFPQKEKQADVLYNLGNAYAKAQQFEQAIETYKQSLSLKASEDAKANKKIVEELLKKKKEQEEKAKSDQQKKDQQDKESKDQNKQDKNQQDSQNQQNSGQPKQEEAQNSSHKDEGMSNKEEQKWLQRLNSGSPTHMYKIKTTTKKDSKNEKPW
jgi:Ca-activated chloride channel family protein